MNLHHVLMIIREIKIVVDVLQYVRPDYKCANTEIQPEEAT